MSLRPKKFVLYILLVPGEYRAEYFLSLRPKKFEVRLAKYKFAATIQPSINCPN